MTGQLKFDAVLQSSKYSKTVFQIRQLSVMKGL